MSKYDVMERRKLNTQLKIMIGRYQRRNLVVDKIEMLAMFLSNEIADIMQGEFAREMNHLVYEEARCCCEGCEMDDPSQMHHDCMMKEQEEILICNYIKTILKVDRWSAIEEHKISGVYLEDSWLKYLLYLVKVDETSACLMRYKNFERKQNKNQDERLKLRMNTGKMKL